jgi:hypothetical protein
MGVRLGGFDIARRTELGFVQPAQISDQTGRLWRVVYADERDDTGQWMIKDCVSFRDSERKSANLAHKQSVFESVRRKN